MTAQPGTLFVVGTPIGNVGDLAERARRTLSAVDVIAAEDTRRTGRLLQLAGVTGRGRLVSFFEGNERARVPELVAALRDGHDVALVSDAGMPGISDPGYRLVRAAADAGITVLVVPGPSAAVAALVASGLPTDRWAVEGFLPRKAGDRRARLASLATDARTVIVFESPQRVAGTLRDLAAAFGEDRPAALARELTKLHEEVLRGSLGELVAEVERRGGVKGEVVLVVGGSSGGGRQAEAPSREALAEEVRTLVDGGMRLRAAAAEVARRHGLSANRVYRAATGAR